ncbi:MAG: T9SS type A sorting domain-containing protein [Bacteroidia bacterium]
MRNLFIIIAICKLFCNISFAQQFIRFNNQYNFGFANGSYMTSNVIKKNNDYLLCGIGINASQNQNYCLGIICTDSVGIQKWQKYSNAPGNFQYNYNSTGSSAIQGLKDGSVLFTGCVSYAYAYSKSCLVKLNKTDGDTIWTKQYVQVGDTSNLYCTNQLSDSSFVSIGYKYWNDGVNTEFQRPFILKTDKNGSYQWHKYLWNSTANLSIQFNKQINLNDKDFIVIGINSNRQGFALKFDTLGNIIFNKNYAINTYSLNYFSDILKLNSGNYLISGNVITYHTFNFSTIKLRPSLLEIEPINGNQVKSKLFGSENYIDHSFGALYQDPGTLNIYANGSEFFPSANFKGTFYKFNSNLDSLYTRYHELTQTGSLIPINIIRSNEGGFVFPMDYTPNSGQQQFCLMKTDTMGCDSTNGCFYYIGINEQNKTATEFKIYPNPSNDFLTISSGLLNTETIVEVKNLFGQKILEQKTMASDKLYQLDIANLQEGVYFLRIKDEGKTSPYIKFIVQH